MQNRQQRRRAAALARLGKTRQLYALVPKSGPLRRDGRPSTVHTSRAMFVPASLARAAQ